MKHIRIALCALSAALAGCGGPDLKTNVETGEWMPLGATNGIHYNDGLMSARYFYEFDIKEVDFAKYAKEKGFPLSEIIEPINAIRYISAQNVYVNQRDLVSEEALKHLKSPLVKSGLFYKNRKEDMHDLLVYDREFGRAYVFFQIR